MDPITIIAAATAAFNGVKKAVELGREVQDVYGQLSEWAGHVGDFHKAVAAMEMRKKKPGLFDKITFAKSETAEAFDMYAAKQKIIEMEKEIYHMFLYGELNHLGRDGYDEFRRMRREVTERRQKMITDQMEARREFFEAIKIWSTVVSILLAGSFMIWLMVDYVLDMGAAAGKW
jgi:hypothetical protein